MRVRASVVCIHMCMWGVRQSCYGGYLSIRILFVIETSTYINGTVVCLRYANASLSHVHNYTLYMVNMYTISIAELGIGYMFS